MVGEKSRREIEKVPCPRASSRYTSDMIPKSGKPLRPVRTWFMRSSVATEVDFIEELHCVAGRAELRSSRRPGTVLHPVILDKMTRKDVELTEAEAICIWPLIGALSPKTHPTKPRGGDARRFAASGLCVFAAAFCFPHPAALVTILFDLRTPQPAVGYQDKGYRSWIKNRTPVTPSVPGPPTRPATTRSRRGRCPNPPTPPLRTGARPPSSCRAPLRRLLRQPPGRLLVLLLGRVRRALLLLRHEGHPHLVHGR